MPKDKAPPHDFEIDPELAAFLRENGFHTLRKLPDGTYAGLLTLLFTTAIHTGLSWGGWAYRYCYEDPKRAVLELYKLSEMDEAPAGYVARRGGAAPADTDYPRR